MNIENLKKVKKKREQSDFISDYAIFNKAAIAMSYLGNLFAIYLSFFYIKYDVLDSAIGDEAANWAIIVASVSFLSLFELMKRLLFNQTCKEFIRTNLKKIKITQYIVSVLSLILVSGSVYFTIQGAQDIASKEEVIETKKTANIDSLTQKIDSVYADKKTNYLKRREMYLKKAEIEASKMEGQRNQWLFNIAAAGFEKANKEVEKVNDKLNEIDSLRKAEIKQVIGDIEKNTESEKEENEEKVWKFILISALIELFIISGILFKNYYSEKSYNIMMDKMKRDPVISNYLLYMELLDIIFKQGKARLGDNVITNPEFYNIIESKGILKGKESEQKGTQFIQTLYYLEVIEQRGGHRTFLCEYEEAKERMVDNFKD